jgi:hypothetical protein
MRKNDIFHLPLINRWIIRHKISGEQVRTNGKTFKDACKSVGWSENNCIGAYVGQVSKGVPKMDYVKPSKKPW